MKSMILKALLPKQVYDQYESPVGLLTIVASTNGLHAILWENESVNSAIEIPHAKNHEVIENTKKQLNEYFLGKRKMFDLPLAPHGTDFQLQAWNALRQIPYATTISYAEQAKQLGDKNKARAVGTANGLNPISIIIPCHRVIGTNGKLRGFRGGLQTKEFLLQLEQRMSSSI